MGTVAWKILGTGGPILAGVVATKVVNLVWAKAGQDEINPKNPDAPVAQGRRVRRGHGPGGRRRPHPHRAQGRRSTTATRPATCPRRSRTEPIS